MNTLNPSSGNSISSIILKQEESVQLFFSDYDKGTRGMDAEHLVQRQKFFSSLVSSGIRLADWVFHRFPENIPTLLENDGEVREVYSKLYGLLGILIEQGNPARGGIPLGTAHRRYLGDRFKRTKAIVEKMEKQKAEVPLVHQSVNLSKEGAEIWEQVKEPGSSLGKPIGFKVRNIQEIHPGQ